MGIREWWHASTHLKRAPAIVKELEQLAMKEREEGFLAPVADRVHELMTHVTA